MTTSDPPRIAIQEYGSADSREPRLATDPGACLPFQEVLRCHFVSRSRSPLCLAAAGTLCGQRLRDHRTPGESEYGRESEAVGRNGRKCPMQVILRQIPCPHGRCRCSLGLRTVASTVEWVHLRGIFDRPRDQLVGTSRELPRRCHCPSLAQESAGTLV